ncbi:poly(ADP-ribose) glycohydrolase 1-like [Dorcoceras hygrometricum]|uniref:poly(ADP-ribose) glycohydrolase n=1 Tax=Dorcoceras hygrometricum TaxID=472368 RepID=A0A2Z7AHH3_9LAMI|nr:poly(ADP-ribose) glycohydrolase 1-like [Dorcoceras hygrometricum]
MCDGTNRCCEDRLNSILPFLPLCRRSSALFWPPVVVEFLKSLSKGPRYSELRTGQLLALAISELRNSLHFPNNYSLRLGFAIFFDNLLSKDDAEKWFGEVLPRLGNLLLRLPDLLEIHYQNAGIFNGLETSLRLLESQHSGVVFLSQELVAALLVCALFGLFPTTNRGAKHLPAINFDNLFVSIYECYHVSLENKIKCIIHYFERICLHMPTGNVSFERKVLPLENSPSGIVYPKTNFWSESVVSLCQLEVHKTGLIEDQYAEALEVDFANKYIGGGALSRGCVQEEIRFMINPELIVSMLFMSSMADNEAIEIIGTERFSNYFDYLLRETNKAFCGLFDQNKYQLYQKLSETIEVQGEKPAQNIKNLFHKSKNLQSASSQSGKQDLSSEPPNANEKKGLHPNLEGTIGIATGNWGCGAFGGDPQVKVAIQWLAASQALRPFILYYTFGLEELNKLEMIVKWIISHEWTVGDLWNMLMDYSFQRFKGNTQVGFFNWLLPSLYNNDDDNDPMMLDE